MMTRSLRLISSKTVLLLSLVLSILAFAMFKTAPVSAAYDGARIIDDSVFRDSTSMSASQIQTFLTSMNSGLKSKQFELSCYGSDSREREWYTDAGATCDEPIPASQIIYYAAKIYGVNPKVILATLQKEQSLITTTNPTNWQISQAMGYGCPDSGDCSSSSNFSYQIDSGTWVLRYHFERANGNNTWWSPSSSWTCGSAKNYYKPNLYPRQNVTFYDDNDVAYRTHKIANAATSAFYCYTPHAYNNPKGLYGLPKYGTKGMYYTGSYNFVKSYEAWFGSTIGGAKDQTLIGDWGASNADEVGLRRGDFYLFDTDNDGEAEVDFDIGKPTDQALIGDWDGDGKDEIGLRRGNRYYYDNDSNGEADVSFQIGNTTNQVFVGDWDGDGDDTLGVRYGNYYYLDNNNDSRGDITIGYGRTTDSVIVGDWDGDGDDEIGLRRGNEYFFDTDKDGSSEVRFKYGKSTQKLLIGDWNNDGKDTLGVRYNNLYFLDNNNDSSGDINFTFGKASDQSIVGDWNNNGADTIGLRRNNRYYYDNNNDGNADFSFILGYY